MIGKSNGLFALTTCQASLQFDFIALKTSQMNVESQHQLSGNAHMFTKYNVCEKLKLETLI